MCIWNVCFESLSEMFLAVDLNTKSMKINVLPNKVARDRSHFQENRL